MKAKTAGHLDVDLGNPSLGQQTMAGKTLGQAHCISLYFMRKQHIKKSYGLHGKGRAISNLHKKVRTFSYLLPKYHHEISLKILIIFSL